MRSNLLACGSFLSRRSIFTSTLSANSALPRAPIKLQLQLQLRSSYHHWPSLPTPVMPQIFDHPQQEPPTANTTISPPPPPPPSVSSTTTTSTTATTKNTSKPKKSHTNDMFSTWMGEGTKRSHASFGISGYAASFLWIG